MNQNLTGSDSPKRSLRYPLLFGIITLAVLAVIVQFLIVMLSAADTASSVDSSSYVERGPIFDRNGRILAIQTQLDSVTAWGPDVVAPQETAELIAPILKLNEREALERLLSSDGFTTIKRTVSPTESEQIAALKQQGKLAGISLRTDWGRSYPEQKTAAHLIGYIGTDNIGLDGIEYFFDDQLAPKASDSTFGNQIYTTIDLNIQHFAESVAQRLQSEHTADSVMILVVDADSGDIFASATVPGFDPNSFARSDIAARKNRPISFIYEPGSVFKVFSIATILEHGGITISDRFDTSGGYHNPTEDFRISDLNDYGIVNAAGIIKYSSNVGAAYASETITRGQLHSGLRGFGFGQKSGIELNGEESALLRPPDRWSQRSQQTIAIGQEIGVTALQIVTAATALANEGIMLKPQLIRRIARPDGQTLRDRRPEEIGRPISAATARTMLQFMQTATEPGGTARRIHIDGLDISAKTGTAEVFDPTLGRYSEEHFTASCLAIFPTAAPRLIVYVAVDYPKQGIIFGGRIAAPAAREIILFLTHHFGIQRGSDIAVNSSDLTPRPKPVLPPFDTTLPDLRGLPKRTLLPLLSQNEIQVTIEGVGWVIEQRPLPGTPITPGMELHLTLQ